MRRSPFVPRPIAILAVLAALSIPTPASDLAWLSTSELPPRERWTAAITPTHPAPRTPLETPRWFPPLADLSIELLDGGTFETPAARGDVVLLDFWATWCAPCREELPHLQRLVGSVADRGVRAIAVNADEPEELIRRFVDQVGLELPVGLYNAKLHSALRIGALPTVVLVDREGRIRYRWDGYREGLEDDIARKVYELLDGDTAPPKTQIARVMMGRGTLVPRWSRVLPPKIDGLAVSRGEGRPELILARPREWAALDADGALAWRADNPTGVSGPLELADLNGDGIDELITYRPGATRVVVFDPKSGSYSSWEAPSHVLDLEPAHDTASVVLATVGGMFRAGFDGDPRPLGNNGKTTSVAAAPSGDIWALSGDSLRKLSGNGDPVASWKAPAEAWSLTLAGHGLITARASVDFATTAFGPAGGLAVLATSDGRLLAVDLADGARRFEAEWAGISALGAGDLDGDGVDEVIVASGSRLTVLDLSR